ncbi:hypothetical protein [Paenibacillus methanolicus]|uniref:Leucine rich repeat (LRR) protein n=1 Tax=Paenibacillus methanolicus TaxID=582686 RepID=A0A5S5CHD9_9BACL|nr:hypothetical protein [Paenibacillus methanolicus]TYP79209.1 hypothetical protein BCM02_101327 [Paenibacillus methanolicus]
MYEHVSRDRIQVDNTLTDDEIGELTQDPELVYLQFSEPFEGSRLDALNDRFFAVRPDVWLRVFGHYGAAPDMSFLDRMTHVTKLSLDCLTEAANLDAIARLSKLRALKLDIYSLPNLEALYAIPDSLEYLHVGKTKSKKPDLYAIQRFSQLKTLELFGQNKNIDAMRYLSRLETVALGSTTLEDANALAQLPRLRSLELSNLGLRDMSGLAELKGLRRLKLWNVKLPGELAFISGLRDLQELTLDAMSAIEELPPLSSLHALRSVRLENLKNLKGLDELEGAPALEAFAHYHVGKMNPEDYLSVLRNPNVRRVNIGFPSGKKYEAFEQLALAHGKIPRSWYD